MKMMNHQRHCLALFLDPVPGHQVSQRLPGAGHPPRTDPRQGEGSRQQAQNGGKLV
jgi:hypothetical protein